MDLIELAKQFGEEIQNNEIYIKLRIQEQKLETDEEFQALMREFNLIKSELNKEISKEDYDKEKVKKLNEAISEKYKKIQENPAMVSYQRLQKEFMEIMNTVNSIIQKSAQGENPQTADCSLDSGCSGSCSGCFGCG